MRRGFLYSTLDRQAQEVPFTGQLLGRAPRLVGEMRRMVDMEVMPGPPHGWGRCVSCEFRRFCNDL